MKALYRGFEIDVHREKCLAGYSMLYVSVFRLRDQREMASYVLDSSDTVRFMIREEKERIDAFLSAPTQDYDYF